MKKVIAIFDIGKTNKKILLFDEKFEVVYRNSIRFDEIVDDDNYPCDDIEAIENWIQNEILRIQKKGDFKIKAINFSTHGATLVYLDKEGNRITPLYNYLKPLDHVDFNEFYDNYGGVDEFSRITASPAYGMLNSGLQIYWLKNYKHHYWEQVEYILHYPQYLSYLFSNKVTADFTSIGAHTATWNFDTMNYHSWLANEEIHLPKPTNVKEAVISNVNGQQIAIGSGLHDSSGSIIPLLKKKDQNEFVLLSTGTWIICMNPNSNETLTQHQLKNNCLCFMTPEKQQIKSSMQFLGRIHEIYIDALSTYYNVDKEKYLDIHLDINLCSSIFENNKRIFLSKGIDTKFDAKPELLKHFPSYEEAYFQLVYEISSKVRSAVDLILDKNNNLKNIYISGGFNKNEIFIHFLSLFKPEITIKIPNIKNESALGAALLMKEYFKNKN